MSKVSIITPHPDDETLGCGGTILKHGAVGDSLHWFIITSMTEDQGFSTQEIKKRQEEIEQVKHMYGFEMVNSLNLPTTQLDTLSLGNIIKAIGTVLVEVKPHIIYLPNRSDVHSDHRIIFQAAWSCCKTFRYHFIRRVLMYEIPSETDFSPALSEAAFIPASSASLSSFIPSPTPVPAAISSEDNTKTLTESL